MLDAGKKNVVGILVNAMDYEAAVEFVAGTRRAGGPASLFFTAATRPLWKD